MATAAARTPQVDELPAPDMLKILDVDRQKGANVASRRKP